VVINSRHGGFGLSSLAIEKLLRMGVSVEEFRHDDIRFRTDPRVIKVVEELGPDANVWCSELKIVEVPDDVEIEIEEYDGAEWVSEKHRTWE
jgi:hypothetical protein